MGFEIKRSASGRSKFLFSCFGVSDVEPLYEGADVLGGKGDNLRLMSEAGCPVPPGFTIVTQMCVDYMSKPKSTMSAVLPQLRRGRRALRNQLGYEPLVSARSGARESMPGMMDTVSNLGLTTAKMGFWQKRIGKRAMLDCRRRLIQEFAVVVEGVEPDLFERVLKSARANACVETDAELSVSELAAVVTEFEAIYEKATGAALPDDAEEQIVRAVEAVFRSWNNERAKHYRTKYGIPHDWGTAVTVQAMVFGNAGLTSGSGVLFTRDPASGRNELIGELLVNAQGEEVVAGTRTPMALGEMEELADPWPIVLKDLTMWAGKLEKHFGDAQDIEFTVEKGKLWILQTRNAKRTDIAAFRIAAEMVEAGLITKAQALARVTAKQYAGLVKPVIDPEFEGEVICTGTGACPGIVSGVAAFDCDNAISRAKNGEPVILVRQQTHPDDLRGMDAAVGVLTAEGGLTSHAAVVAREMNTACVVGAADVFSKVLPGDVITINGQTGEVWAGEVPVIGGGENEFAQTLLEWAYEATGAMVQGPEVVARRQRVTTNLWNGDGATAERNLRKIEAMDDRSGIILDLSVERLRLEEDALLWNCFGKNGSALVDLKPAEALIEELLNAKRDLTGTVVFLPALLVPFRSSLKSAGFQIASIANTLADVFGSDGFVNVTETFIDEVCGGPEAYAKLIELMAKDGAGVKPLPIGRTPVEIAADAFGKE